MQFSQDENNHWDSNTYQVKARHKPQSRFLAFDS